MIRFALTRLALIPAGLLLANCLGYLLPGLVRLERGPAAPPLGAALAGLFRSYGGYLQGLLRGDVGMLTAGADSGAIPRLIAQGAVASLGLLALALLLSIIMGMLLGMLAVRTNPPGVRLWLTSVTTVGLAMPGFYVGSLLIAGVLIYMIYGPGRVGQPPLPIQGFGWDRHLVLPTLVLMLQPTARIAQTTASLLSDELGKQYVVAARSLGHSWQRITRRYALRNVLAAVIVAIAGSLRLMVGELIIVERLFDWPGIGRLAALTLVPGRIVGTESASFFLNPPLLAGLLTVFAGLFLLADFVAALLARVYDPRLRTA